MTKHTRHLARFGMLMMMSFALIAGHGIFLYYGWSHAALPAAAMLGMVLLLVVKHLGLFGTLLRPLLSRFRRRP